MAQSNDNPGAEPGESDAQVGKETELSNQQSAFKKEDIAILEPTEGYERQERVPVIVLEQLDGTAAEHEAKHSDGTTQNLSDHYGDAVSDNDPVYEVRDLYIVDGEVTVGDSNYRVPEGKLTPYKTAGNNGSEVDNQGE